MFEMFVNAEGGLTTAGYAVTFLRGGYCPCLHYVLHKDL